MVSGNTEFAVNFYHAFRRSSDDDLFFSPYSLSTSLAMTYAGAANETQRQIADALCFSSTAPKNLHRSFNTLNTVLTRLDKHNVPEEEAPELKIGNALWGQNGYEFLPEFLDTVSSDYGAHLTQLDFERDPDGAAIAINQWADESTNGKITQIIDPLMLRNARIVLTNAIYFKGQWLHEFNETFTEKRYFYLQDDGIVLVPMMHQTTYFDYSEGEDYQAVELPYKGGALSLVVLLPKEGKFQDFEEALDAESLERIISQLEGWEVMLFMPRFKMEMGLNAKDPLQDLGMKDAFSKESADFSEMVDADILAERQEILYISNVVQKTFVEINETGTEAAAVTAVINSVNTLGVDKEPVVMDINRPFIFLIRERDTGTLLFLGRIMDPRE